MDNESWGACAARDWESDSPEQLEREVSLTALDVLRIASRSRSNRAQLLALGILPSLTRLMEVEWSCRICDDKTTPQSSHDI